MQSGQPLIWYHIIQKNTRTEVESFCAKKKKKKKHHPCAYVSTPGRHDWIFRLLDRRYCIQSPLRSEAYTLSVVR